MEIPLSSIVSMVDIALVRISGSSRLGLLTSLLNAAHCSKPGLCHQRLGQAIKSAAASNRDWCTIAKVDNKLLGLVVWSYDDTEVSTLLIQLCITVSLPTVCHLLLSDAIAFAWSLPKCANIRFAPETDSLHFSTGHSISDFTVAGLQNIPSSTSALSGVLSLDKTPTDATTALFSAVNAVVSSDSDVPYSILRMPRTTRNFDLLPTRVSLHHATDEHDHIVTYIAWAVINDTAGNEYAVALLQLNAGAPTSPSTSVSSSTTSAQ